MKKLLFFSMLLMLLMLSAIPAKAACSGSSPNWTAASPSQADVAACVALAVDGDTIHVPAGSATWTVKITVTGKGITIIGAGTPNGGASTTGASATCSQTIITDSLTTGPLFSINPNFGNSLSRLSCMQLINTVPTTGYGEPIEVLGSCTASGCPNFRMDNITGLSTWGGAGISDDTFLAPVNVFGVVDHNTIGDIKPVSGNGVDMVNPAMATWLSATGGWGDLSWASADSFGTANSFFVENNLLSYALVTDTDTNLGTGGGARLTCRFNTVNNISSGGGCTGHGTDTTGRARGVRQWEVYNNTGTCTAGNTGCGSFAPGRSGVGMSFNNTFTNVPDPNPIPANFTNGSAVISGANGWYSGQQVKLFTTGTLPTNFATGTPYFILTTGLSRTQYELSLTNGGSAIVAGSAGSGTQTAVSITPGFFKGMTTLDAQRRWRPDSPWAGCSGSTVWDVNDGTTYYGPDTITNVTGAGNPYVITIGTSPWTTNQWSPNGDPYSINDSTQSGEGYTIGSNTANTATNASSTAGSAGAYVPVIGDTFTILRSTVCMDQPTRSGGWLVENLTPILANGPGAGNPGSVAQVLDPTYEANDAITSTGNSFPVTSNTASIIANRDYYTESKNQAAQTNATSPFNGTSGTGHGTYARIPTTCTNGTGYWATDQGTWNQGGAGGQLYICSGGVFPAAGSPSYVPYTYPHPLDSSSGTVATPTFAPGAGSYSSAQTVTISTASGGATLCYTTDGSTPTEVGNACSGGTTLTYTTPITVSTTETVKALGTLSGSVDSSVASALYTITLGIRPAPATNLMVKSITQSIISNLIQGI